MNPEPIENFLIPPHPAFPPNSGRKEGVEGQTRKWRRKNGR
jgi:hypothetical protein